MLEKCSWNSYVISLTWSFQGSKVLVTNHPCRGVSLKQCCECGRTSRMCLDEVDTSSGSNILTPSDLNQDPPFQENQDLAVSINAMSYRRIICIKLPVRTCMCTVFQIRDTRILSKKWHKIWQQRFHDVVHLVSTFHSQKNKHGIFRSFKRMAMWSAPAIWTPTFGKRFNLVVIRQVYK